MTGTSDIYIAQALHLGARISRAKNVIHTPGVSVATYGLALQHMDTRLNDTDKITPTDTAAMVERQE